MRHSIWLIAAVALIGGALWLQSGSRTPHGAGSHTPSVEAPRAAQLGHARSAPSSAPQSASRSAPSAAPASALLPPEAQDLLRRIAAGGPFEHRQDGSVFQNRERRLPRQPRGYYREYTVETPGERDRGARRIVTGGAPPVEYYYTDDHYRSFTRFDPATGAAQ